VSNLSSFDELPPLVGYACVFGDGVSSENIVALRRAAAPAVGDFVVAGLDFGVGAASTAAVAILKSAGVAAVISRSFAPTFYRAAIAAGLPALVVEETGAVRPGDRLRVDLEEHKIANLSSGDRYIIRNLQDETLDVLRAGGLATYLANHGYELGRTRH
jgi:3-isopropylmalate dehydratase small subunit